MVGRTPAVRHKGCWSRVVEELRAERLLGGGAKSRLRPRWFTRARLSRRGLNAGVPRGAGRSFGSDARTEAIPTSRRNGGHVGGRGRAQHRVVDREGRRREWHRPQGQLDRDRRSGQGSAKASAANSHISRSKSMIASTLSFVVSVFTAQSLVVAMEPLQRCGNGTASSHNRGAVGGRRTWGRGWPELGRPTPRP